MSKSVDLIISVFNQPVYTRLCLQSVFEHTDRKLYNLIVIDNGCLPKTRKYLAELHNAKQIDQLIRFDENQSVVKAYNKALQKCKGDYVCFLHNDCIVTPHWLFDLRDHFERDLAVEEEIAVLNPATNYSMEQSCVHHKIRKKFVRYKLSNKEKATEEQVQKVLKKTYGDLWEYAEKTTQLFMIGYSKELSSFCMFFRKSALDHIGGFDERFQLHGYQHKELFNRLVASGYEAWVARDVFIHHFGNVTSDGPGFDLSEILQKHEKLIDEIDEERLRKLL